MQWTKSGDADISPQGQNSASQTLGQGGQEAIQPRGCVGKVVVCVTPTPPHPPPPTGRADRPGGKARPLPRVCSGVRALLRQWQTYRRGDPGEALQEETAKLPSQWGVELEPRGAWILPSCPSLHTYHTISFPLDASPPSRLK